MRVSMSYVVGLFVLLGLSLGVQNAPAQQYTLQDALTAYGNASRAGNQASADVPNFQTAITTQQTALNTATAWYATFNNMPPATQATIELCFSNASMDISAANADYNRAVTVLASGNNALPIAYKDYNNPINNYEASCAWSQTALDDFLWASKYYNNNKTVLTGDCAGNITMANYYMQLYVNGGGT